MVGSRSTHIHVCCEPHPETRSSKRGVWALLPTRACRRHEDVLCGCLRGAASRQYSKAFPSARCSCWSQNVSLLLVVLPCLLALCSCVEASYAMQAMSDFHSPPAAAT
jgi:hypothetical protein